MINLLKVWTDDELIEQLNNNKNSILAGDKVGDRLKQNELLVNELKKRGVIKNVKELK